MQRLVTATALCVLALASTAPARADLIGTTVDGTLNFTSLANFFDPAIGFVPGGFGNKIANSPSVVISDPVVEFGFSNGANTDTADFTGSGLTVGAVSTSAFGVGRFVMTFTDPAFAGLTLTKVGDTFPGAVDGVLNGDEIVVTFAGTLGAFAARATFTLLPAAAVPEPSSLTLGVIAAAAGLCALTRKARPSGLAGSR